MLQWMQPEQHFVLELRYILFTRRSEAELPARVEEVHHAKEEGDNLQSSLTILLRSLTDDKGLGNGY